MRSIHETGSTILTWVKLKSGYRNFELRFGEEAVGTLQWKSRWRSRAAAETADGSWAFDRKGVLKQKVTINSPGGEEVAVFHPNWKDGGSLEFPDGRKFQWVRSSFWHDEYAFATMDGQEILHLERLRGLKHIVKEESQVEIVPDWLGIRELSLLVSLAWYLTLLHADDAAVAATTAGA